LGFQRGDGVLFMEEVRRGDEHHGDLLQLEELPVVIGHENVRPEIELELGQRAGIDVGARHDADALFRMVRKLGQCASSAGTDDSNQEIFLRGHVGFPLSLES
jgi:hypothetical protein